MKNRVKKGDMMSEPTMERRDVERFDLSIPAKIESMTPTREEETMNLLTSDVCSGGAFFHTSQPLREGVQVKVSLVLSFDKLEGLKDEWKQALIKVNGRVLRCESSGMVICFDSDYEIQHTGQGFSREVLPV